MKLQCGVAVFAFAVATNAATPITEWWQLGPFPRGKTEYDAEPGGVYNDLSNFKSDKRQFISEQAAPGGFVNWRKLIVGSQGIVQASNPTDWNQLAQSMSDMNVLQFQSWFVSEFNVENTGIYTITCKGVHTYEIVSPKSKRYSPTSRTPPIMGDVYSSGELPGLPILLDSGVHTIRTLITGKAQAQFQCNFGRTEQPNNLQLSAMEPKVVQKPDIVAGRQFSNVVSVALSNPTLEWLDVDVDVVPVGKKLAKTKKNASKKKNKGKKDKDKDKGAHQISAKANGGVTHVAIAPGQRRVVHLSIDLEQPGSTPPSVLHNPTAEESECIQVDLSILAHVRSKNRNSNDGGGNPDSLPLAQGKVPVVLRCRHLKQAFLFTFIDHDGTASNAAAIAPWSECKGASAASAAAASAADRSGGGASSNADDNSGGIVSCPVCVTHSGVGASPMSQADSYKYKLSTEQGTGGGKDDNEPYVFGFDGAWLLAPERGGAHNWEGQGALSAAAALRALAALAGPFDRTRGADPDRVVSTGHSRGGHGASLFATRYPDSVTALSMLSGWFDRELYGDANPSFTHDIQLSYVDPHLRAILDASVAEHRGDLVAANLRAIPSMVRTGGVDTTVPIWHSRRFARVLKDNGVSVEYSEVKNQGHWWWDTEMPNDGGVVFDRTVRGFLTKHLDSSIPPLPTAAAATEVVSYNPATFSSVGGILILQLAIPGRIGRVIFKQRDEEVWDMTTVNVARFAVLQPKGARKIVLPKTIKVDGWQTECCKMQATGFAAAEGGSQIHFVRSHATKGRERRDGDGDGDDGDGNLNERAGARMTSDYSWAIQNDGATYQHTARGPSNYGPIRQVFAKPWMIVVGSGASDGEAQSTLALARYMANSHYGAVGTEVPLVMDHDVEALSRSSTGSSGGSATSTRRRVLIGTVRNNVLLQDVAAVSGLPFAITSNRITLHKENGGRCTFSGPGLGFVSLAPAGDGDDLQLVVSGTDTDGIQALVSQLFSSSQSLTRALFSNMLPDFILVDATKFRQRGYGGVLGAGYYTNNWKVSDASAYLQC